MADKTQDTLLTIRNSIDRGLNRSQRMNLLQGRSSMVNGTSSDRSLMSVSSGIDKLNKNIIYNNKLLIKTLNDFNKNSKKSFLQKPKDLVRREDPMKKFINEIDDIEEILIRQERERKIKPKGGGLLGLLGLGGLLGIGGLIGFLLTGKKGGLEAVTKILTKYSPLKFLVGIFDNALKSVASGILRFSGLKSLSKNIGDFIFKNVDNFVKPVFGIFKGIGDIFGPLGKIFGGGMKVAGKGAGKLGKSFFKKIPVIGSLLGLFFGIQRFKKGDYVGGALEIVSGMSSMIPGVGTAVGIGIDAVLLLKDLGLDNFLKGKNEERKKQGKKGSFDYKKIPGIGFIFSVIDSIKEFIKDPISGLRSIGSVIGGIVGGPGMNVINGIIEIVDVIKNKAGKLIEKPVDIIKDVIQNPVKNAGKLWSKGKELFSKGKGAVGQGMGKGMGIIKSGASNLMGGIGALSSGFEDGFQAAQKDGKETDMMSLKGGHGWILYKPWKPDVMNLDKGVWDNFTGMASEYYEKTGKMIQVNSGYRSQKGSLHGVGQAIDINSEDANRLESMKLMHKWKFHRPLIRSMGETWHVEPYPGSEYGPRNTNNLKYRRAVAGGDGNLPSEKIPKQVLNNDKEISLSLESINLLAQKIVEGNSNLVPRPVRATMGVSTNSRG
jgi:hypothetical protein